MTELPSGTVTFLFTDIEGSTALLKALGHDRYAEVLEVHDRIVRAAVTAYRGQVVDTQGDALFVAFVTAADAVSAAVGAQRDLAAERWPDGATVRVRMGLHTGEPRVGEQRYVGIGVHRAASDRRCGARRSGSSVVDHARARGGRSFAGCLDPRPGRASSEGHRPAAAPLPAGHRRPAERLRSAAHARCRTAAPASAYVCGLGGDRCRRGCSRDSGLRVRPGRVSERGDGPRRRGGSDRSRLEPGRRGGLRRRPSQRDRRQFRLALGASTATTGASHASIRAR